MWGRWRTDVEVTPKHHEDPPPACFCMQGRWMKQERCRNWMAHGGALSKYIVLVIRDMAWARYSHNDMRRVHRWLHVVSTLWLSATGGKGRSWIRTISGLYPYVPAEAPKMCISPLFSSLPPTRMPAQIAKSTIVEIRWPTSLSLEGRSLVPMSLSVEGPKKDESGWCFNTRIFKRVIYELLTF